MSSLRFQVENDQPLRGRRDGGDGHKRRIPLFIIPNELDVHLIRAGANWSILSAADGTTGQDELE